MLRRMTSNMLQTISGNSKPMFYIGKHRNPYIGHFQVTKTRDFRDFLKIIHKLTSFLTSCTVVWRQKHSKLSQEPPKQIFYIGKHWNPYIGHFQVTNTQDFTNFLKIIHKLTSFLRCVASYDVKNASINLRNLENRF